MILRKYTLILLALLVSLSAAAMTIEELTQLYKDSTPAAEFTPQAQAFIESSEDLDELNYAGYLWANSDSTSYQSYLSMMQAAFPANPKYQYLKIGTQPDPQTRIRFSRDLIKAYPKYAGGYLALFFNHLSNLAANAKSQPDSPVPDQVLTADLPLIAEYARLFPQEKYVRMTQIFHLLMQGDAEAAKTPFREALEADDAWLADFDLARVIPLQKYHPLLRYHIDFLRQQDSDPQVKYTLAQKAGDLISYYYDTAKDYDAIIGYFGAEPFYWENQYVIYCLAMSYYQKNDLKSIPPLLIWQDNTSAAEAFQDAWIAFDKPQCNAVYTAALQGVPNQLLASYLLARAALDDSGKLAKGKSMVKAAPKENYGYRLINDYYVNYFGAVKTDDAQRKKMVASLKKDKKYFQKHRELFPESVSAIVGSLLSSLAAKKDAQALASFQKLLSTEVPADIYPLIYKLIADFDRTDLLLKASEEAAQSKVGTEYDTAEEAHNYAVVSFCQALYDNGQYQKMLSIVDKHPDWLKIRDLQFLLVNSHYFQNDYAKAIAMLRFMVDQGTVGSTMLNTLASDPIAQDPGWQALVDYAATKPDPDAGADQDNSGNSEEPAELDGE